MAIGNHRGELLEVDGTGQVKGLLIYRASRLEKLLEPLTQLLAATRPDHVLAPQTLIAAHPGMKQWLTGALARAHGSDGIAANLDILLPSAWINRLAQQQLGQQAVSLPRYQRQHLRWNIYELLGDGAAAIGVEDTRVAGYLRTNEGGAADQARRRFQLADRLARIYSQYLVYRPDWLRAWERGKFDIATHGKGDRIAMATERNLLAPLWRHLRDELGLNRADVVASLMEHLQHVAAPVAGGALHVFGISHLAPSELAVLRAVARQRLVAFYVPDPCREYWGGLGKTLPQIRQRRADELERLEQADGGDYWVEQSHPLLASWGRLGQHFIMALADGEADVLEDVRHWRDEQSERPSSRLGRVQQSIRELDPSLMAAPVVDAADAEAQRRDASLRIHSCHTRLRELEVLRDQLLDALAMPDDHGERIKPSDIVVMAPDIHHYASLIPSVFGIPGDSSERLPYHMADVVLARGHALLGAFRRLLDLPGARLTAPEVVDLLAIPEVARRLGLDVAGVAELADWLQRSRVAWALDPTFRQRFGAPPIVEYTFGWALDRMLTGYLMADASTDDLQSSVNLTDGSELAPLTAIHGPAASHLGALDQLLQQIQVLCDLAGKSLLASEWAEELERRFEAIFRVDLTDRDALEAKSMLLRFIRSIASEPQAAGENPLVHFSVVRDLLVDKLSSSPESQRFLMGGVTFCGMVPQRAIPFKIVAVLGLNDGEFPRSSSDGGLDLMTRYRRLGDRDVRTDDRYLFLETLMSARERLHLSFIGQGVGDGKSRNPAAPLAELLAALDAAADLRPDDQQTDRPWRVQHPLQPFDARYFNQHDLRLFSYNARFAAMHGRGTRSAVDPFLDRGSVHAPEEEPQRSLTLQALCAYYKDPARQVLGQHMHLSLDALDDDRLPQQEPLEPRFAARDAVAQRLLLGDALPADQWPPEQPPAWLRLSGMLPPGRPGQSAWANEVVLVEKMLELVRGLPGFEPTVPAVGQQEIDLRLAQHRVVGQVRNVYATYVDGREYVQLLRAFSGDKGKLKTEKSLSFKDRVPMFLDWAMLRLRTAQGGTVPPAIRLRALLDPKDQRWQDGINAWDEGFIAATATQQASLLTELERRVVQLLRWWIDAQDQPRWYFPKAAWETIKDAVYGKGDHREDSTADAGHLPTAGIGSSWVAGHGGIGERDYAPGYAHLLAGEVDFATGSLELRELQNFAVQLHECITLGIGAAGAEA